MNEVNNYSLIIEEFKEMWNRAKEKSKELNVNYNIVVDINNTEINADDYLIPVSYTHLTLPTIYSV